MSSIKLSKTSKIGFALQQLFKGATNLNPIAFFANGLCDYLNTLQVNNIIDFVQMLDKQIDDIIERIEPEIFLSTLQKVKDEMNEEKRKLYASYIVACVHFDNSDCDNKSIYLNLLDQLDYLSIDILKVLENYNTESRLIEKNGKNYNKDAVLVRLWSLCSLNLTEKISAGELDDSRKYLGNIKSRNPKMPLYKRTGLGERLFDFIIKGMPNNE